MSRRSAPMKIRRRATRAPRRRAKRRCSRAVPAATIFRPSVVFGPEDQFSNRFAALARVSPFLPLIGGGLTKLQPVYVGDVATAVADAVDGKTKEGAVYELGGPEVLTMREVMEIILAVIERKRMFASLPFGLAKLQALALQFAPGPLKTDAGPGGVAARRQCGVGCGEGRRADAGRLGRSRRIRWKPLRRSISGASARWDSFRRRARKPLSCPGRSAARSTCEAVRCRAGAVTNSGAWYGPGSAERHEECRTASGTRALLPQRQRDQAECADDHAPPGEQRKTVAGDVIQKRFHHDDRGDERHHESDRDDP